MDESRARGGVGPAKEGLRVSLAGLPRVDPAAFRRLSPPSSGSSAEVLGSGDAALMWILENTGLRE
jgi:hypothetical protein